MRKGFFPKLALINIKKNGQSYFPFMISCICTVMMYYIMHSISKNKGIFELYGAAYIMEILNLGTVVIAIFSARVCHFNKRITKIFPYFARFSLLFLCLHDIIIV